MDTAISNKPNQCLCFQEITEEFCEQMQHLNVLNIRDNKLEVFPENVSLLQNLKGLI